MKYPFYFFFSLFLIVNVGFAQTEFTYGTTNSGGKYDAGTLFRVKPDGSEREILHHFQFVASSVPNGKLVPDGNETIYGISEQGGDFSKGTLFSYSVNNDEFEVLHHFENDAIGANPTDVLYLTKNNTLIGATEDGRTPFEYDLTSNQMRSIKAFHTVSPNYHLYNLFEYKNKILVSLFNRLNETTLLEYDIDLDSAVQFQLTDSVVLNKAFRANDSILIGSAVLPNNSFNGSFIYQLNVRTDSVTLVKKFSPTKEGYNINENLIKINETTFIGSCLQGGLNSVGTIFSYNYQNHSTDTLYKFKHLTGSVPNNLVRIDSTTFLGNCSFGGTNNEGTTFSYDISLDSLSVLLNLEDRIHGKHPGTSALQLNNDQVFFTTNRGGKGQAGTLLKYDNSKDSLSIQFNFNSSNTGAFPVSNLIQLGRKLIGCTSVGNGFYEYDLPSASYRPIFNGSSALPQLIKIDSLSFLSFGGGVIGPASVFQFDKFANLIESKPLIDSIYSIRPVGYWLKHSNGKFYGSGNNDGKNSKGCLFEYDPVSSNVRIIHHFEDSPIIGENPIGSLVEDKIGNLIGIAKNNLSSKLFKYDIDSKVIQGVADLNIGSSLDQLYGIQLYNDSLIFGLLNRQQHIIFYKYDLTQQAFNLIDSSQFAGNNSKFIKPILGNDSNIYYSIYNSGINHDGKINRYEVSKDSLYQFIEFSATNNANGLNPNELLFLSPFTTSIQEISRVSNNLTVYPNPFQDRLSIRALEKIEEVHVFNQLGSQVYRQTNLNDDSLELEVQLDSGVYFIIVNTSNKVYSSIVIKL